ncbi:hypothetical protein RclHR1_12500001 [Rhizophagus clarus]|uniref:Zn(2)-C6 fungal-type domain-containing protein n=1 Tax=Rhizophagus clarus TaxID=94130 RepID=A0A2Z6Q7B1_9GLOM|nr:hypothetical protein RclHR1_12500001 [Rhizophagus clarus]
METSRRTFPSLSPYSLNDTHIPASQQPPTFHYDSNDHQRLYTPSEHHIPSYSSYANNPRVRTGADTSTSKQSSSLGMMNSGLGVEEGSSGTMKRTNKTHVPSACVNCKRAHLACDVSRPCKRCVALGKVDTCIDIKHKKRGRPKLKDKKPHPYNTHATADAKTWVQNPQFLPPATTNSNPNLHQQNDQPPNSSTLIQTTQHSSSRHHLHHNNHNRHHSTPYIKSPKFIPRQQTYPQQDNTPVITMFLAIDNIACARVSDECLGIMGYYPSELVHKSLYEYVHTQDREKLRKMISSLLDDANRFYNQTNHQHQYQFSSPLSDLITTEDPGFSQINPEILQVPAQGGQIIEISDVLHLKQRIGPYDMYEVRMYLGGGFYADLTRKETWNKLYIVALFKRIKSGTSFSNEGSNYVQPRVNGNFSTQITSPPTTTIDPALLTMHTSINNNNIGSPNSSLGVVRSGLLSPVLSPRQPEIGPSPPLYNEINHSPHSSHSSHTYFGHRKPLHPCNSHDHSSQDRNISETFSSFVSRPNPITPIISRHEPLVSPSTCSPSSCSSSTCSSSTCSPPTCSPSGSQSPFSFERRPSAFNSVRSPPALSIPFYNEIENKSLDSSPYTINQSNRFHNNNNNNNDNIAFHSHQNNHDEISSDNSFPTFRNNERVEDMVIPTIPRKTSSHMSAVRDGSTSTTRMSVNSLLCN